MNCGGLLNPRDIEILTRAQATVSVYLALVSSVRDADDNFIGNAKRTTQLSFETLVSVAAESLEPDRESWGMGSPRNITSTAPYQQREQRILDTLTRQGIQFPGRNFLHPFLEHPDPTEELHPGDYIQVLSTFLRSITDYIHLIDHFSGIGQMTDRAIYEPTVNELSALLNPPRNSLKNN